MPQMKLKDFNFEVDTASYQTLTRKTSYKWAEHTRLTNKPKLHFTGISADVITLAGVILPHFKGGLKQIDAMRLMAAEGKRMPLISGLGDVFGDFVITEISEAHTIFLADGVPLKMTFSLSLKEYAE